VSRGRLALCCVVLAGCAALRPRPSGPLVPAKLPPLEDDLDLASLRAAIERTQPAWARAGDAAAAAAGDRLLAILGSTDDPKARRAAVAHAFRVVRFREPLLLTAYYEPELAARFARDATFRHPLYARPPDLVDVEPRTLDETCTCRRLSGRVEGGRLQPYPSRADIEGGALAGRGLELAWVADPIALFVLHVQGSGWLRRDDGALVGVRWAGSNGRPYRSVARALVARGLLADEHATLPDMRRALAALPPAEQAAVLATDERYTFFQLADGGAEGSLGVELTPGRSIATDPQLVPPGALAYLETPGFHRFVVSQDAGAAIVGARADLFLGAGAEAEERAGRTRERGHLYLLLPR
jgi:membrane-bound lytic murein transglycosylase A